MGFLEATLGFATATYVIVFLAAVAEALPVLGVLVPGHFLVLAAGATAASGKVNVWSVAIVASLGAIVGDALAYTLARRTGARLLSPFMGRFGLTEARLDAARAAVHKNPFLAIVVGRFNSFTRALAPFAAGLVEYPAGRFLAYNIAGGIAWGTSAAFIGLAFGEGFRAAEGVIGRVAAALGVMVIIIVVGTFLLRRIHPDITCQEAAWLAASAVAFTGFLVIAETIPEGEGLVAYDAPIGAIIHATATGPLFEFFDTISEWGGTLPVALALLGIIVVLLWDRRPVEALRVIVLSGLAVGSVEIIKLFVARPRPVGSTDTGYSFPSGHTTMAALLVCLVAWYASQKFRPRAVVISTLVAAATWIALMGVSRIAVGAHYATDVLAGACLGIAVGGMGLAGPSVALRVAERAEEITLRLRERRAQSSRGTGRER